MQVRVFMFTACSLVSSLLSAQTSSDEPDFRGPDPEVAVPLSSEAADDDDNLRLELSDLDPLEYSQNERQAKFSGGMALNIGPVIPWSESGASFFWSRYSLIQSLTLGVGDFEFSDNYRDRNYRVKTDTQILYYATRWFFLGFGPLYVEPFAGFVRWSGSIKPSGYDNVNDTLASALDSRFDINGLSLGTNLGLMWIFDTGIFVDYNLFNISSAAFVSRRFTTNTDAAKKSVRKELVGPSTMSNFHLRIGYSLAI